jgi:hypothetical protein
MEQQDAIIKEIHHVREEIAAEYENDVHAFFEYLRQRERLNSEHVVTLQPLAPEPSDRTSGVNSIQNGSANY